MSLNLPRNLQEAIRSGFREWHQSWGHAYPHDGPDPSTHGHPGTPIAAEDVVGGAGASDHGDLTGLTDDDHTQYALETAVQDGTLVYAADAGGTDAYAITLTPAITAYATGQVFHFKANTANTGAATLAVNGLAATPIKKQNDQDLATGDIEAGQIVTVVYDAGPTPDVFQMQSQTAAASGGVTDHGALTGLTDDDHTQYLKEKASGGTAAEIPEHSHLSTATGGVISRVIYGELTDTAQGADKLRFPSFEWQDEATLTFDKLVIVFYTASTVAHSFTFFKNGASVGAVTVAAAARRGESIVTNFTLTSSDYFSVRHDTNGQDADESASHVDEGGMIAAYVVEAENSS